MLSVIDSGCGQKTIQGSFNHCFLGANPKAIGMTSYHEPNRMRMNHEGLKVQDSSGRFEVGLGISGSMPAAVMIARPNSSKETAEG
jgi:hypothetical protein